jgi:CheY-like chemotaxis protein
MHRLPDLSFWDWEGRDGKNRPDRGGQRAEHEALSRWIKDDPQLRAIPVVAVTAFAMKGDEERIREGGCEAYLSKPISVGKFIETVRRFIG